MLMGVLATQESEGTIIMDRRNAFREDLRVIVFAAVVLILAVASALYLNDPFSATLSGSQRTLRGLGRGIGQTGLTLLILVYARTAFKLLVRKESFWKRLEPFNVDPTKLKTVSQKILYTLNISHPYLGVSAIALIYLHCYFISRFYNLLPLRLVLALLAWQGIWGLVLKARMTPAKVKGRIHLFHSQLFTGAAILLAAALGHWLLG
jgi:hypothetical protein